MVGQILTKALAAYDIYTRMDKMTEAVDNGDFAGIAWQSAMVALDILTITSTCFDGDTLIATEEGQKRIDEIEVGDRVWAYNVETGELELKEVLTVYVKENDEILYLKTTEGDIDTTTNHPFYVMGKGWVAVGDLEVEDKVLTIDGSVGDVLSFELEKLDAPIPVYNIEVDDFHTYFVGDGNGWVLVHNQYKTGDLYESTFTTKEGIPVQAAAEVIVDGKVVRLTNGVMYPVGGDMPNVLGQIGLRDWLRLAKAEFKAQGFEKSIMEGVRAEHSSSANPGSVWDLIIDLTKEREEIDEIQR